MCFPGEAMFAFNSPMPFKDFGSPAHPFNTYAFYYYLSMMLSKDTQVTQSCVSTIKRLHMEFFALVIRNCHNRCF